MYLVTVPEDAIARSQQKAGITQEDVDLYAKFNREKEKWLGFLKAAGELLVKEGKVKRDGADWKTIRDPLMDAMVRCGMDKADLDAELKSRAKALPPGGSKKKRLRKATLNFVLELCTATPAKAEKEPTRRSTWNQLKKENPQLASERPRCLASFQDHLNG
jgi:hypothetical protein